MKKYRSVTKGKLRKDDEVCSRKKGSVWVKTFNNGCPISIYLSDNMKVRRPLKSRNVNGKRK
jgi:hypothetical protein